MKVIIIGGIAAGMSAAAKLKRSQKEAQVIVYEKTPHISFGGCGLPYFVGGFFDRAENLFARTPQQAIESGIEVYVEHEVLSVNAEEKTVEVKNLQTGEVFTEAYDKLMIATGASPVVPPINNIHLENIYTLRDMNDGHILRAKMQDESIQKVGIIGAGFIGLEVAEAAKKLGKEVTVFQSGDRVLKGSFDKEITDILETEIKAAGVDLRLNTMVTGFNGTDKVEQIVTADGAFDVDLVVLAIGVRPNTGFLKNVGFDMLPNGAIIVDDEGRTSVEDIYAAGDCATVPHLLKEEPAYIPLATSANKLGRTVGENLGGAHEKFEGTLASSCLKALHMEAGRTGLSEDEVAEMGIEYKTTFITEKNHTNYLPGQSDIYIKLIYDANTKVILGGQIVGKKDAVLRTNTLAAAIYAKMTTKQLGMLDLCYAPPFARTWDALNVAGNVAK
ncbi:MAG: CoA-disulfide reductase [Cellulosilyticum sp.]|nr:CoA-disulfide reductase [Cellulosilyticum sp.]